MRKATFHSLLAVITLVLLSSVGGGGAIAAPILLPLHFLAAKSTRMTPVKVLWAILGAATAAEGIWLITYLLTDESQPLIWLLPALAGVAAGTVISVGPRRLVANRRAPG